MKKIVFITPNLTQPRCIKRVEAFYKKGWRSIVYGYTRGLYDVNSYAEGVCVNVLSGMTSDNGSQKFKQVFSDIRRITANQGEKDTVYYAFGLLPALSLLLLRKSYIYEISDIMYAYPRFRRVEWFFKKLDRFLIRKSLVTVLTSEGFSLYLGVPTSNVVLLQNKVNRLFTSFQRESITYTDKYRFGFVGAIRYESVLRFAEIVGKDFPQHEFHFFGGTGQKVKWRCIDMEKRYGNIYYHGPFVNPDDLIDIYGQLDIVVACYDVNSVNEQIAEPNKLFEAMFFCRPIIVSEGTFLAKQVHRYGCGYSIDASSEESIRSFIKSLQPQSLSVISSNEKLIPVSELLDPSDSIVTRLDSIVRDL